MTYRILSNESDYLSLTYDDNEIIEKIGEDYLIQADPSPIQFAKVWQKVSVNFTDTGGGRKQKTIPDIQHHFGHLFLSNKAIDVLKPDLIELGELLEVEYDGGKQGCIFNPLKIVDADSKFSVKNDIGDVVSLSFNDEDFVFKTGFDNYYGIFCSQKFKSIVEQRGLTGIAFEKDLSNIFERTNNTGKPTIN